MTGEVTMVSVIVGFDWSIVDADWLTAVTCQKDIHLSTRIHIYKQ